MIHLKALTKNPFRCQMTVKRKKTTNTFKEKKRMNNTLKQAVSTAGNSGLAAMTAKQLDASSSELLKVRNAESASAKIPVIGLFLRFAGWIRKAINDQRMAQGGAGTRVSLNYVIDGMFDEGNEEVTFTDEQLDKFGRALKSHLGATGFVSAAEIEDSATHCKNWYLKNIRNAENAKGEPIFTDATFAATFPTISEQPKAQPEQAA